MIDPFYLRLVLAVLITAIVVIFLFVIITQKNSPYQNLIKNMSPHESMEKRAYSFSRVQLFYWTSIVLICYVIGYAMTGSYNLLNSSCLILLGISAGTTATGKIIDISQINTKPNPDKPLHQNAKTKGFFLDILSDETGVSVHRFQAFIFNLLFGGVFIISFINSDFATLPAFEQYVLGLIGLSSGTYIALKTNENGTKTAPTTTPPAPTTTPPATTTTPPDKKPALEEVSPKDSKKDNPKQKDDPS